MTAISKKGGYVEQLPPYSLRGTLKEKEAFFFFF